jgi:hypothetical protein
MGKEAMSETAYRKGDPARNSAASKACTAVVEKLLAAALLGPASLPCTLPAQTLYWNKATPDLTWANSSNAHWASTPDGTTYGTWNSSNIAEIVTANARINMGPPR